MKRILFVCKHNRFRSKIAEGLFKKYNDNKNYSASSAGILQGKPVDSNVKRLCKQAGFRIGSRPRGITTTLLSKQDIIVIVADDVPKKIFTHKGKYIQKVIRYNIPDVFTHKDQDIKKTIKAIEKKIKQLVRSLP